VFGIFKFLFVLVSALFGAFILAPTVLAAGLFALAAFGDPGDCGAGPSPALSQAQLASVFDAKWSAVQYQVALGQQASVTFTEDEVTARAARFLEEQGRAGTVRDLRICFGDDGAVEVSGTVSPPLGPDFRVRGRGHVSVPSAHPAASITELRVGSVPGFISGLAAGPINDFLQSQFQSIVVAPRVDLAVRDGELTVTARPYVSAHGPGDGQSER
jgi:hypothetical protein